MMSVTRLTKTRIPTQFGTFDLILYDSPDGKEHMAFVMGSPIAERPIVARVHSECFTGDVMGSRRCDCGAQLERAMQIIGQRGEGIVVYLRQEGRGIGLLDKLKAYNLQDEGYDTVDANLMLGHGADERDYTIAAAIFKDLGVTSLKLLTNNPAKLEALDQLGLDVIERIPLEIPPHADNHFYLHTKRTRMDHLLDTPNGHQNNTERAS